MLNGNFIFPEQNAIVIIVFVNAKFYLNWFQFCEFLLLPQFNKTKNKTQISPIYIFFLRFHWCRIKSHYYCFVIAFSFEYQPLNRVRVFFRVFFSLLLFELGMISIKFDASKCWIWITNICFGWQKPHKFKFKNRIWKDEKMKRKRNNFKKKKRKKTLQKQNYYWFISISFFNRIISLRIFMNLIWCEE